MSTRERFSRKSLKKPDEFLTTTGKMIRYFEEHRNRVVAGILGVVVLFMSILGVLYNMQSREARMESLLSEMKHVLTQDKDKNPDQVSKDLDRLLEKFGDGSQKQRAQLMIADFNFQKNQFDKAITLYSDIVANSATGELNRDLAQRGLAYAFEGKKEFKKAIEAYKSMVDRKSFSLPLFPVYMDLSRNYELDNDKKNALLLLREMINKFRNVRELEQINQQISRLEGKS